MSRRLGTWNELSTLLVCPFDEIIRPALGNEGIIEEFWRRRKDTNGNHFA